MYFGSNLIYYSIGTESSWRWLLLFHWSGNSWWRISTWHYPCWKGRSRLLWDWFGTWLDLWASRVQINFNWGMMIYNIVNYTFHTYIFSKILCLLPVCLFLSSRTLPIHLPFQASLVLQTLSLIFIPSPYVALLLICFFMPCIWDIF